MLFFVTIFKIRLLLFCDKKKKFMVSSSLLGERSKVRGGGEAGVNGSAQMKKSQAEHFQAAQHQKETTGSE